MLLLYKEILSARDSMLAQHPVDELPACSICSCAATALSRESLQVLQLHPQGSIPVLAAE
jgi:hypothetical protein